MNLFHIDTETTGFDVKKHEIIELAFAIEIDGITHCKMELFMRPEKWDTIDRRALDSNGWTIERLKELPNRNIMIDLFFDVAGKLWLESGCFKLVEYGNGFDYRFLESSWNSKHPPYPFTHLFNKDSINVLSMAKKKLPGLKSYKLKEVARRLGIPVIESKLHAAGYDRDLMMGIYNILKWR